MLALTKTLQLLGNLVSRPMWNPPPLVLWNSRERPCLQQHIPGPQFVVEVPENARQLMMMIMMMSQSVPAEAARYVTLPVRYCHGPARRLERLAYGCQNPGDSWCYNMTADVPRQTHKLNHSETNGRRTPVTARGHWVRRKMRPERSK